MRKLAVPFALALPAILAAATLATAHFAGAYNPAGGSLKGPWAPYLGFLNLIGVAVSVAGPAAAAVIPAGRPLAARVVDGLVHGVAGGAWYIGFLLTTMLVLQIFA